ncbi:hypothetical protein GQ42DRAFT_34506 [Ramicandelaber brevisporus]|nr:hypothetical protein GQ42DRAFT_34506 [Ramicandelaber brevisporus]
MHSYMHSYIHSFIHPSCMNGSKLSMAHVLTMIPLVLLFLLLLLVDGFFFSQQDRIILFPLISFILFFRIRIRIPFHRAGHDDGEFLVPISLFDSLLVMWASDALLLRYQPSPSLSLSSLSSLLFFHDVGSLVITRPSIVFFPLLLLYTSYSLSLLYHIVLCLAFSLPFCVCVCVRPLLFYH